jgi:hypothetical protein
VTVAVTITVTDDNVEGGENINNPHNKCSAMKRFMIDDNDIAWQR